MPHPALQKLIIVDFIELISVKWLGIFPIHDAGFYV